MSVVALGFSDRQRAQEELFYEDSQQVGNMLASHIYRYGKSLQPHSSVIISPGVRAPLGGARLTLKSHALRFKAIHWVV